MNKQARLRFSVRSLLVMLALVAIGTVVWRNYIYESPTDKLPQYERAIPVSGLKANLGATEVSVRVVVRNERDAGLYLQDGKGREFGMVPLHDEKSLTNPRSWLDVVRIELEPDDGGFAIKRLRVFDHETRTLLEDSGAPVGYRVVPDNDLLIFGLGVDLPETLDIWLDVDAYQPGSKPYRLEPMVNASIDLPSGRASIAGLQSGSGRYVDNVFQPAEHVSKGRTRIELKWTNEDDAPETGSVVVDSVGDVYQVAAVDARGNVVVSSERLQPKRNNTFYFAMTFSEIEFFQLQAIDEGIKTNGRPFFFDGIQVAKNRRVPFKKPPTVKIPIDGPLQMELKELHPIEVGFDLRAGQWERVIAGQSLEWIAKVNEEGFELGFWMKGLANCSPNFALQSVSPSSWTIPSRSTNASSSRKVLGVIRYESELSSVGELSVIIE